jgi:hypothetical protein
MSQRWMNTVIRPTVCEEENCQQPEKMTDLDVGIPGSYCLKHLQERMVEAGILDSRSS